MGWSKIFWHLIWAMFFLHLSPIVQGQNETYNRGSLDDFLRDYAYKNDLRPRTGILQNISLPSNFSGMEVSFVRVRTRTFWLHGANYTSFHIPPSVLPRPFVARFDLFYQNLGNWSSHYYDVANHTLVSPVVALMVYDATSARIGRNLTLDFNASGDPMLVRFSNTSLPQDKNATLRCVRFGGNGSVEITNVTSSGACVAKSHGHFAIVMPLPPPPPPGEEARGRRWRRWVIGFGAGIGGLVLALVLGFLVYKLVKRKRIGKMERESERSEALDTMWIGRSRMPSATRIRTQPVIENEYVP